MVTLQQDINMTGMVVEHWWQQTRREHRLFLRLVTEKPEHLANLPYLEIILTKLDGIRVRELRSSYPKSVVDIRTYLLSAERSFLGCLRALRSGNKAEADIFYNQAHDDLSLLQFVFMENGIKSYI